MLHTYEAVLHPNGQLQFFDLPSDALQLPRRVLVTFLDEAASGNTALYSVHLNELPMALDYCKNWEG